MKDIKTLTLKEAADQESERIEEEVLSKEELTSIEVTPKMDRNMEELIRQYEKETAQRKIEYKDGIEEYLSEEDQKALAIGRKMLDQDKTHNKTLPKNLKFWAALAAVMILLLAVGMTGVGSKSYWKELWSRMVGEQENTVINVKDAEIMESEDGDERGYFVEIEQELDVPIVFPRKIPEEMYVNNYEIDTKQRIAKVFYDYKGKMILYAIYANGMDSSYTEKVPDVHVDTFNVETGSQRIIVEEYLVEESQEYRYITYFEYGKIQYQFMGIMDREDFVEILKNLYFY